VTTALRGRFKPYPAYKASGIEWLGGIPETWVVRPVKHLTRFTTGWTPPTGREELYGGNHFWANISDLGPRVLITTQKTISDEAIRTARLAVVQAGSLLFSFKLSVGLVSLVGADMFTNEAIAAFAPSPYIDTEYLYWAAPVFIPRNAQENIYGAPLLSRERIANASMASPPLAEQRTIATFLDRETARIDALVAKKERLIELLHEKRTALITRAVTEGLNADVLMKNSGVEGLGTVPAHWEIQKTAWLFSVGSGTTPRSDDPSYYGGDTPWITTSELRETVVRSTEKSVSSLALREHPSLRVHPKGSVAVAMYGATIGRLGILGVDATVNQACCVFSSSKRVDSLFWFYWLQMRRLYLISLGYGGGQPNLSQDLLRSIRVPTPPLPEQLAIVTSLDRETTGIDALVVKVRDAIDRLKELRTALISAAVTGKIDVREEVA
jgi:type I restriction enzyme S subunit